MFAALLLMLACAGPAPVLDGLPPGIDAPTGGAARPTQHGLYRLAWAPAPSPLPTSALFELEVTLTDAEGRPVEDAKVWADAKMPQHGHGMTTKPEPDPGQCTPDGACRHPGGRYVVRGMKFHMPGDWVLEFEVHGPAGRDFLTTTVRL